MLMNQDRKCIKDKRIARKLKEFPSLAKDNVCKESLLNDQRIKAEKAFASLRETVAKKGFLTDEEIEEEIVLARKHIRKH